MGVTDFKVRGTLQQLTPLCINKKGRKMKKNNLELPSIYIQAVVAMMLVLLLHYIVRAIPGALGYGGPAKIVVPTLTCLLIVGIVLVFLKKKFGLIFGFLNGAWMIFQPILVHIIKGLPDKNGIWWYPALPWTISILVIYFCYLAWKNWDRIIEGGNKNE
jgi:hypothetical protein